MSATLDAAVHLGQNYLENLLSTKNQTQRTMRQSFDVSQKLITDQTEIQGISKIGWHTDPWQRTTLLRDTGVGNRQQKSMSSPIQYCVLAK